MLCARQGHESVSDVRDCCSFPFVISPGGLFASLLSVPSWGSVWHWGKIHTKRRWSLLTTQPSQGWETGPWRSPARPPLGLFVTRNPPGLCNSAPAREERCEKTWNLKKIFALKMYKWVVEEATCPNWSRAVSKPPTWSLFLKRSKGYVMVLLIIPAPLPQMRLRKLPWR